MAGQVMVEKARREGIRAMARATEARRAEAILRKKVESLSAVASVQHWARANGFVAPEETSWASVRRSLVASR